MYNDDKNSKPSLIIVAIIFILLVASAYNAATTTITRISQPQKEILKIGTNTPFPPFEYKSGDSVVGFDIELAKKIGEKLGRNVQIVDFSDFSAIFPALENDNIKIAISAITITPERSEIFNFSVPYYNTSQALLTTKTNLNNIKISSTELSVKDFKGLNIGVQDKTTSQSWIESNLNGTIKSVSLFGDLSMSLQTMRLGGIDGIVVDESVAIELVKYYPDLAIVGVVNTNEQYGIMVKGGDPENLLPKINEVISEMKSNGEYDELIKKYFGGN